MSKQRKVKVSDWIFDKLRLSLTLRLNFRTTADLFMTFLKLNVILVISIVLLIFYTSDRALLKTKDSISGIDFENVVLLNENISAYNFDDFKEENYKYYIPLNRVYNTFSYHSDVIDRKLYLTPGIYILNIPRLDYKMEINRGDTHYLLVYNLTDFYYGLGVFIIGLLFVEGIFIIVQLFKSKKSISASLSPIYELTETVKEINGSDLAKRISIVGTQNEFVDLTQEINAMLDRIQNSYDAQSRFVSDASHELRTPIAVIQGYTNLLDRWGKTNPEALAESIDAIKSETESMKKLVEQLLFLARGDRENLSSTKKPIELLSIAEEVFTESKVIDKTHIYKLGKTEEVWIYGDTNLIKQSIRIFIDNARKYTEDEKQITLEVYRDNNQAVVSIQDEGMGMTNHDINHMFERFFRADESRTRKDGGSGLGLSIADQILRLHNADVKIISMVDIGTKIVISFPVFENQERTNIA